MVILSVVQLAVKSSGHENTAGIEASRGRGQESMTAKNRCIHLYVKNSVCHQCDHVCRGRAKCLGDGHLTFEVFLSATLHVGV